MPDGGGLAAIALGSNLPSEFGGPEQNLKEAINRVSVLGEVVRVSSFHRTEPELYVAQPMFSNAALLLRTLLEPETLLGELLSIERAMGRVREGVPAKGPRLIDLDLIFYEDVVLKTRDLELPHPSMAERGFVLAPLAEIAPEWVHPVSGMTVREMLARLP